MCGPVLASILGPDGKALDTEVSFLVEEIFGTGMKCFAWVAKVDGPIEPSTSSSSKRWHSFSQKIPGSVRAGVGKNF